MFEKTKNSALAVSPESIPILIIDISHILDEDLGKKSENFAVFSETFTDSGRLLHYTPPTYSTSGLVKLSLNVQLLGYRANILTKLYQFYT